MAAASMLLLSSLYSCKDDLELQPGKEKGPEATIDLENSLVVPLSISLGDIDGTTRADGDGELVNGTSSEHIIDFDIEDECFAMFFDEDGNFMTLRRLYKNTSLGNGGYPNDGIGEYQVYAVAYLDKPEGWEQPDKSEEEQKAWEKERLKLLPSKILVVLNGGRVYGSIHTKYNINKETGYLENKNDVHHVSEFLEFEWDYEMGNDIVDSEGEETRRLLVIGENNSGHYTMTNSAYFGPDDEKSKDESKYTLQTVRPIDRTKIKDALAANIKPDNCAANIYVERMVAKFSAPVFSTEVIGSNKVFRPSQDARPVVIYSYNTKNGTWISKETNWRVHVLGWTINGREKRNYLYKKIAEYDESTQKWKNYELKNWEISNTDGKGWNDFDHRRSYWSIDPHYEYNPNNDKADEQGNYPGDFYPWQFRRAMDKQHISWYTQNGQEDNHIALRYLKFDEIKYWDETAINVCENTFNPYYNDNYKDICILNSPDYLDTRASVLMGPHLLVTAELYLANDDANTTNDYLGFARVPDLYGDRYFRYFQSEEEMFRMFVRDINDALRTQSTMSFKNYKWNINEPGKNNPDTYVAEPTGSVQLMFDCELGEAYENKLSTTDHAIYLNLKSHKSDFHGKEVSKVIDKLVQYKIPFSIEADIKDGDARIIPWIPGMVYRRTDEFETRLIVYNKEDANKKEIPWDDDMRKSLILEWYGPVDHYKNGYMYYAADIPHHIVNPDTKEGYYGAVRNHWYTFTVTSINSLGTPISDPGQRIIPEKYKYRDQMSVYVEPARWHFIPEVDIPFGKQ